MAYYKDGVREGVKESGGVVKEGHQSSLCSLWSGVPVLFLTSTKPSPLGSNQSVTLQQAGGTEWSVCIRACTCVCTCEYLNVQVCTGFEGHIRPAKDN